jgi:imidazole glycerol-phosphate synthase subunit HisH
MKPPIAVIDYGMGNLRSVEKALQKVGGNAQVTRSPEAIRTAAGIVLPGVGAFGEAVKRLRAQGLWQPIRDALQEGRPFLGICLGLQLLFEGSDEDRRRAGLGWLKGRVVRFRSAPKRRLKVPHIGWNTLALQNGAAKGILAGVKATDRFYFVHSFFPAPKDVHMIAAATEYGGLFCSAIERGPVFACQFHPEKSGAAGLRLLSRFVQRVKRWPC